MATIHNSVSEVSDKPVDDVQLEQSFIPWRVFVNQIDSYHGKKLAEVSWTKLHLILRIQR